ncbi:nitrous oxide reductase family maturation protein NosD [Meiothermus sp.]|uniref:right-handed parallel beta-helix repeat-containing protein n=1 Tax=Meiothermus sp. TaxID=1955249 RepID=UPI0026019F9F|nr:right-handed parallel beta-helix repeat-containing protein [Meiothermus sp.]
MTPPGNDPPPRVIYVRAGATGGNGGEEKPFGSIAQAVQAAPPGSTIRVAAGTYRESVRITKPLTLIGEPGATIKGSDVFTGWTREGNYWVRAYTPGFNRILRGECRLGSNARCKLPDQVFIDGEPLFQETLLSEVGPGDFFVGDGKIYLGSDPTNRTVEVTNRYRWIEGVNRVGDVRISGFVFRHAGVDAQHGGIFDGGGPRWIIENNDVAYAHGAGIETNGDGAQVLNNLIHHNGQLGLAGDTGVGMVIRGNKVYRNNTEDFSTDWEAGGSKWALVKNLLVEDNESYENLGSGFWCDIHCDGVVFRNNRLHHNWKAGLQYEVSKNCTIEGNQAWENGFGYPLWGWGAGILVQNSSSCVVRNNLVAWNADGISVVQQIRDDHNATEVSNVRVENNLIAVKAIGVLDYALGWLSDTDNRTLYSNGTNSGDSNRFFREPTVTAQNVTHRVNYAWAGEISDIDRFRTTPGGGGNSQEIGRTELENVLRAANLPLQPERSSP